MSTPTGPGRPSDQAPDQSATSPPLQRPVRIPRRDTDIGRVIDAPTSGVEQDHLPKDLPDLDKIHQVGSAAPPPASAPTEPVPTAPVASAAPSAESETPAGESSGSTPARAASVRTRAGSGPVRASMQLRSIDPWSTFKVAGVVSIVLFFVWMIAVGALYVVLNGMGVWEKINDSFQTLVNEQEGATLLGASDVFWYATLVGVANVVLLTALATLGSFIYNLCADLVGGVEVTLADRD